MAMGRYGVVNGRQTSMVVCIVLTNEKIDSRCLISGCSSEGQ